MYEKLNCTKIDILRWKNNLYSTHASTRSHKIKVILKAVDLFHLSQEQAESLANKAGLSLLIYTKKQIELQDRLKILLKNCGSRQRRLLYSQAVSERMIQYYLTGKEPTKQALLAMAIILELPLTEMEELLRNYGYCLSLSLINDIVVRWFMDNKKNMKGAEMLYIINETLDTLELPLLMTKQINRD